MFHAHQILQDTTLAFPNDDGIGKLMIGTLQYELLGILDQLQETLKLRAIVAACKAPEHTLGPKTATLQRGWAGALLLNKLSLSLVEPRQK